MSRHRDELLDHEYDGIREFDNALPRWWLYGFYFTIAFAVVYAVNYHVLPTPLWGRAGQVAEYEADVAAAQQRAGTRSPAPGPAAAVVVLTDAASLKRGQQIYEGENLCHACHRKDLGGMVGPNLTDALWIHGCAPGDLVKNVSTGFPTQGMLAYGNGTRLAEADVQLVVSYILSKQGSTPPDPRAVDPSRETACP
jgi:cytochrome c oxidase cbb3-type subunit III